MPIMCPYCAASQSTVDSSGQGKMVCWSCGGSFALALGSTVEAGPPVVSRRFGKFEVFDKVGSGTFGAVYKARDTELGRTVAVKIPRTTNLTEQGAAERFVREAQ